MGPIITTKGKTFPDDASEVLGPEISATGRLGDPDMLTVEASRGPTPPLPWSESVSLRATYEHVEGNNEFLLNSVKCIAAAAALVAYS